MDPVTLLGPTLMLGAIAVALMERNAREKRKERADRDRAERDRTTPHGE